MVKMATNTPRLAAMANCWITPMSITSRVMKPTASASKAVVPGMNSARKVRREASSGPCPCAISLIIRLMFCTAWLMPMAKIRKGTRIE
ncbi:hypothetical protein D9M71_290100 [compost metagenome]